MRGCWLRAFLLSIPVTLWLFALAVVSVATAVNWDSWKRSAAEIEAGFGSTNRYSGYLAICAVIGVSLLGVAVVYWWRVPRERRLSWRTWIFAVPMTAGLVALGLKVLGYAMRGAILG